MSSIGLKAVIIRNKVLGEFRQSYHGSFTDLQNYGSNLSHNHRHPITSTRNIKIKKATIESILTWKNGLRSILNDYYGLYHFNEFLKSEYSNENLDFWLACEKYRSMAGRKRISEQAQSIYSEYIAIGSENQVNLDAKVRVQIIENLSLPNKALYDAAQSSIFSLMAKDSYGRFLRSKYYLDLLKNE